MRQEGLYAVGEVLVFRDLPQPSLRMAMPILKPRLWAVLTPLVVTRPFSANGAEISILLHWPRPFHYVAVHTFL